jgi:hypothetical protein
MPAFAQRAGSSRFSLGVFITGLGLWPAPAAAQEMGSFSIPVLAVEVAGGASVSQQSIFLPNAGTPVFVMPLVLPRDYQNGGDVKIVLYLQTSTATTCQVRLAPAQMFRKRAGFFPMSGLAGLNGNPVTSLTTSEITTRTFTLKPGGTLSGQKPGDVFSINFNRIATDVSDTCANTVVVHAIDIRYPKPP